MAVEKPYFCTVTIMAKPPQELNVLARKTLRTSYISTVVSIALVLFMIGVLAIMVLHARKISEYLRENITLTVMIKPDSREGDVDRLIKKLEESHKVKSVVFTSKEEAAEILKEDLGEDFISFLGYNPLLASIDVQLNAEYANTSSVDSLQIAINDSRATQEILYQQSLADEINKNIKTVGMIITCFSILLLFIAAGLINNTIRLSLYSKRLLIKSMRLVGATRGFIRRPFLVSSMIQGLWGAGIAILLLGIVLYVAKRELPELVDISDMEMLFKVLLYVVAGGVFISGISTYFAVNKYLKRSSEDFY
jgi:cell division transport system permease protein